MPVSTHVWMQWVAATVLANIVVAALGFPLRLLWGWEDYLNSELPILLLCGMSAVAVGVSQWTLLRTRSTISSKYFFATTLGCLPLLVLLTVPSGAGFGFALMALEGDKFGVLRAFGTLFLLVVMAAMLLGFLQRLTLRSTFSEVRKARWVVATVLGAVCGIVASIYLRASVLGIEAQELDYRSNYLTTIVQLFELWVCVAAAQGVSVNRLLRGGEYRD